MEGNQMKMREAVEAALAELDKFGQCHDARLHFADIVHIGRARGMLQDALSAPARNCDRLSAEQCKKIFKMEMGIYLPQEATDRDRDIARCTAYGVIDALFAPTDAPFAPSTEQKGEGDGGNQQKMREALFLFVHDFASFRKDVEHGILHMMQCMDFVKEFIPLMESALSAPPRQCDVGTAEEQAQRFGKFCIRHKRELEAGEDGEIGPSACVDCKVDKLQNEQNGQFVDCGITWAQTPYAAEEGSDI